MARAQHSRPVRILSGLVTLAALALLALWASRVLSRRGALDHFDAVRSLDTLPAPGFAPYLAAGACALALLTFLRRPWLAQPRAATAVVGGALLGFAAPLATVVGHQVLLLVLALLAAGLFALPGPADGPRIPARLERAAPWILWAGLFAVHAAYSMHRHAWYGSGSWDHGCMVHNFYRASRFLDTISTVLGDVDFLGDHFMIGIYLYAPIAWVDASGYMVLAVQAANLAAVGPAIYLIARHHRLGFGPALALALATGLSFGLQSAAYFDSHEITVGFGFLAWGLWAFETGRLRAATALFVVFALFKESLGAYVVGLGLLGIWRGLVGHDRRAVWYGVGWVLFGAIWFVLVNRVFMPTLIARGNPPEPHETFGDFGPTVFEAAIGIVTHPTKALAALFVPDEKLVSLGVTFGGTGGLALLSPQVGLAALPLFAERFLSSKQTMWQMGYHYAASLSLYAGWAAARGFGGAERALARGLRRLGGRARPLAARWLALYVLLAAFAVNALGYRHESNYFRWTESYFASPERKAVQDRAVALLEGEGRGARLAVQNRLLPHLADRPVVYRLGDWEKADWVLLVVGESAWPWDRGYPKRLARRLHGEEGWRLVFSEATTAIFARAGVTDRPTVEPSPALGLPRRPSTAPARPRLAPSVMPTPRAPSETRNLP